jgi:hypothetical protein
MILTPLRSVRTDWESMRAKLHTPLNKIDFFSPKSILFCPSKTNMPVITILRQVDFDLDENNNLNDIIYPQKTPIPYLPEVFDDLVDVVFDDFEVHDERVVHEEQVLEDGEILQEMREVLEEGEIPDDFLCEMTEKEADDVFEALAIAVEKSGHDDLMDIMDKIGIQNRLPCLECLRVDKTEMLRCQRCKNQPMHFLGQQLMTGLWNWNVSMVRDGDIFGNYTIEDRTFEDEYFSDDDGDDSEGPYGPTPNFM